MSTFDTEMLMDEDLSCLVPSVNILAKWDELAVTSLKTNSQDRGSQRRRGGYLIQVPFFA